MISEMQRVPGYVGVTATWQVIFGGSVDADQQTAVNVYTQSSVSQQDCLTRPRPRGAKGVLHWTT